jgi:hypothetical protein
VKNYRRKLAPSLIRLGLSNLGGLALTHNRFGVLNRSCKGNCRLCVRRVTYFAPSSLSLVTHLGSLLVSNGIILCSRPGPDRRGSVRSPFPVTFPSSKHKQAKDPQYTRSYKVFAYLRMIGHNVPYSTRRSLRPVGQRSARRRMLQ